MPREMMDLPVEPAARGTSTSMQGGREMNGRLTDYTSGMQRNTDVYSTENLTST